MAMCYVVKDLSWGWIFALGWVISGFANQNLFCAQVQSHLCLAVLCLNYVVHELSHFGRFRRSAAPFAPARRSLAILKRVSVTPPDGCALLRRHRPLRVLPPFRCITGPCPTILLPAPQHELSHFLAFKKPLYNKVLSVLSNTVLVVPTATTFRKYHQEHHSHLVRGGGKGYGLGLG